MEDNDYHYSVLGLEPGATDEEVRAAYRRLIKIYHPDRDSSLDAEMKYREIQDAYSALRGKRIVTDPGRPRGEKKRKTAENSGQRDHADAKYDDAQGAGSGLGDFLSDDEIPYPPRIPFSWGKLGTILWDSLKESMRLGLVVRTCLCVRLLWILFRTPVFPQLLGMAVIPCLLVGCLIFRYYNVNPVRKKFFLIASVGSAFVASLCYTWFTFPESRKLQVESVFFVTLGSLLVLWVKVKLDFLATFLRIRMKRPHER